MIYLDTSVLVALIVPEAHSATVARWYGRSRSQLVSAAWCVTEFGSALGIKRRTGQLDAPQAQQAWQRFVRLITNDLVLLALPDATFHRAAALTLDAATGLRAGDALHLACAERAGVASIATLDGVLLRAAQQLKIKPLVFS